MAGPAKAARAVAGSSFSAQEERREVAAPRAALSAPRPMTTDYKLTQERILRALAGSALDPSTFKTIVQEAQRDPAMGVLFKPPSGGHARGHGPVPRGGVVVVDSLAYRTQ